MAKLKRRHFSAEEKVAMIRLHLIEQKPISEICDEHKILPTQFYRWQQEFFENGAAAFDKKRGPKSDPRDRKIEQLEQKVVDRDEGLAELMLEHVKLKKKLGLS